MKAAIFIITTLLMTYGHAFPRFRLPTLNRADSESDAAAFSNHGVGASAGRGAAVSTGRGSSAATENHNDGFSSLLLNTAGSHTSSIANGGLFGSAAIRSESSAIAKNTERYPYLGRNRYFLRPISAAESRSDGAALNAFSTAAGEAEAGGVAEGHGGTVAAASEVDASVDGLVNRVGSSSSAIGHGGPHASVAVSAGSSAVSSSH